MTRHPSPIRKLRCAIYTRKSTEEGLDQAFNSLHAQREACEAYVQSQAGEGWSVIKTAYDDGGFSGGNTDRPALQRLLVDIDAGLVDIVLVYKVDRLTRSLSDFAKVVDRFDSAKVSFVSVTQAFNTTSSMGRLTLNVLLSFAQFEREVTGERIRDKIAQSKAKGMWMGGVPPLGYALPTDLVSRRLTVVETEAELVRSIFSSYLALGSVSLLQQRLDQEGARSKSWTTRKGRAMGGLPFSRGQLFHLLRNRVYRGQIVHRDTAVADAHPPLVDQHTFDAVQAMLAKNGVNRVSSAASVMAAPLRGKLFDRVGRPMSPVFTANRHGRTYRYYVSAPLQAGIRRQDDPSLLRLSAAVLEEVLATRLATIFPGLGNMFAIQRADICEGGVRLKIDGALVTPKGASLSEAMCESELRLAQGEDLHRTGKTTLTLTLRTLFKMRGGQTVAVRPDGRDPISSTRRDTTLIGALQRSHKLASHHGLLVGRADLQPVTAPDDPYDRKLARLAFLAPDIQAAILEGRQPAGLTVQDLMRSDLPLSWATQRELLGF